MIYWYKKFEFFWNMSICHKLFVIWREESTKAFVSVEQSLGLRKKSFKASSTYMQSYT